MIERESQIKELYDLKHRRDNELHTHFDYEAELLNKLMPQYSRRNGTVNNFCNRIQSIFVWGIETNLILRNFYNYTVDKYYSKHTN